MDIVLVPGFWLDASSWDAVTPALVEAGHRVHPLTLPGLESRDADRAGIGLADHVAFVTEQVDALGDEVVLVGHSGGGAIIHQVVDRRPDRVSRAVYVDSGPPPAGTPINDELPEAGDEIPLPSWDTFTEMDLVDLDDELRERFRARAVPQPKRVATDPVELADQRRFDVPVTVIACEFPGQVVRDAIDAEEAWVGELARVRDLELVDLPTGHWPQFTRPADLGTAILRAVRPRGRQ